jgi:hypothetical protein
MNTTFKNTAAATLIAMISAAPMAALAATDANMPAGSVLTDPRAPEAAQIERTSITTELNDPKISYVPGQEADKYEAANVVENLEGSIASDVAGIR